MQQPPPSLSREPQRASMIPLSSQSSLGPGSRLLSSQQGMSRMSFGPRHSIAPMRNTPYSRGTPSSAGLSSGGGLVASSLKRPSSIRRSSPSSSRKSWLPSGNSASKDSRPLRDKNYLALIGEQLYNYLISNKFEFDMKHPLTQKTMKAPTQRDFVLIFQWLYKRLDPAYKFTKSIENEVYFILKLLNYPFMDSINKSQISAVGGHNWPYYLGMLHWLMELNMTMDAYSIEKVEQKPVFDADGLDQIFIRYISRSYRAFLNLEDDYTEYKNEMKKEFDQYTSKVYEELDSITAENEELENKKKSLNNTVGNLENLTRKGVALESDLVKFKTYINTMEKRKQRWPSVLEKIVEELEAAKKQLEENDKIKTDLQAKIKEQGLQPADIDRINAERENLNRALERVTSSHDKMTKLCAEKEEVARTELETLESLIHQYNTSIYRLTSLPKDENENPIALDVSLDMPLSDSNLGARPEDLLKGKDLANIIRPALLKFRYEISTRTHRVREELIKQQDQLERVSESLSEKHDQVSNLEAKLSTLRSTNESIYENMQSEIPARNAEIEKMEMQLQNLQLSITQGMMQLNQRSQSVAIESEQLKHALQQERENKLSEIGKMIIYITDFKVFIQESLEEYDKKVLDEWISTTGSK